MRGRIFATQVVSANFISLLPLLLIGAITDIVNITPVLLLLAAAMATLGFVSNSVGSPSERQRAEAREPESAGSRN
jgi:hypothetical protein